LQGGKYFRKYFEWNLKNKWERWPREPSVVLKTLRRIWTGQNSESWMGCKGMILMKSCMIP
jgi:hypothetical protein